MFSCQFPLSLPPCLHFLCLCHLIWLCFCFHPFSILFPLSLLFSLCLQHPWLPIQIFKCSLMCDLGAIYVLSWWLDIIAHLNGDATFWGLCYQLWQILQHQCVIVAVGDLSL